MNMTDQEIIEKSACGLSEDIDGEFYQLYDPNKICELKDEQYKVVIKSNLYALNRILETINNEDSNETKIEVIESIATTEYALLKQFAHKKLTAVE